MSSAGLLMAIHAGHATTRSARYALGPGADMPVARIVALLLILLPIGAFFGVSNISRAVPSQEPKDIANFNPRAVFPHNTPPFLPTPLPALPPHLHPDPPPPPPS